MHRPPIRRVTKPRKFHSLHLVHATRRCVLLVARDRTVPTVPAAMSTPSYVRNGVRSRWTRIDRPVHAYCTVRVAAQLPCHGQGWHSCGHFNVVGLAHTTRNLLCEVHGGCPIALGRVCATILSHSGRAPGGQYEQIAEIVLVNTSIQYVFAMGAERIQAN